MLIVFIFFDIVVTTKLFTCNLFFFSVNVLKLTNVELQLFSRVKTPFQGRGGGKMLGGFAFRLQGDGRP